MTMGFVVVIDVSTSGFPSRRFLGAPARGTGLLCAAVASSVLWLRELCKVVMRAGVTLRPS
jgi:hypothetical protein